MKKLPVYIPFEEYKNIGGPATFMKNLKNYLDENKISYLNTPQKAAVIFFPVKFDTYILKYIKNRGGKVIQRLDGIYYPSKHGEKHREANKKIKYIYLNQTDFAVFQSNHCKDQCFQMFGHKKEENYTIITNGVNKNIFYPDKKTTLDKKIKLITTGKFRNMDMLEPVIKALDVLKDKLDFELLIAGPVINPALKSLVGRDYINCVGGKKLEDVSELLRKSHIFIYSHLNPPCPNSVIEAVSSGLPVVGFDSGAMKELLYFGTDLLAHVSDDIFQKYEDFSHKKLAEKILLSVENYEIYRKKAIEHSNLYSFEECGKKYVEVFGNLQEMADIKNYKLNTLQITLYFYIYKLVKKLKNIKNIGKDFKKIDF